jgi:hypothetical protein
MVSDDQDGQGNDLSTDSEAGPESPSAQAARVVPESTAERPRLQYHEGSWASEHVPLILLVVIVLVLVFAGMMSSDTVTCPGGASSCGYP